MGMRKKRTKNFINQHAAHRGSKRFLRACRRRKERKSHHRSPLNEHIATKFKHKTPQNEYKDYKFISAPQSFSVIKNAEETLEFMNKVLHNYEKKRKTFIDLSNVEQVADDALVLLLAYMLMFRSSKIPFNGNFPQDRESRKKIKDSGFLDTLYEKVKQRNSYDIGQGSNRFRTHANKIVDQEKTDEIIKDASTTIWGEARRCPKVQRSLIELMQNTNNHAGKTPGQQHWWMSVAQNAKEHKVTISFIDFGMGVLKSLDSKKENENFFRWRTLLDKFHPGVKTDAENMKLIMEGALYQDKPASATNKYYRGKGLPGIYKAMQENAFTNLIIITNKVYANVSTDDYSMLKNELKGTFVSWELNKDITSLSWI